MAYYEFPHTENYDEDLGWLIEQYGNILEDEEAQNKAIEDLDARVTALEAGGGGGGGKNYDKEIADLYSKITTLTTTVTNNKKASDTSITTLTNSLTALTTRVKTLEADNVTNKSKINLLDQGLSNVEADIDTIESTLAAYDKRITALEEGGGGKDYDEEIAALQTGLSDLAATVDTNKTLTDGSITQIKETLISYNTRLTAVEEKAATNSTNIENINNKCDGYDQSIATINDTLTAYDERIKKLEAGGGGGGDYDQEIKELQDGLSALTETVATNKSLTDGDIASINTTINDLRSRIITLEEDNVTNKTNINALQDEIVNKMVKSEVEALPDIADADANTLYVVYEDGAYKEYIVSNISGTKAFVELVSSSGGGGGSVVINKITEFSGSYNVGEFYQYAPNNYYIYFYIAISDSILMPLSGTSNKTGYNGIVPVQAIPCGAISGAVTEMKYIFGYDNGFYARVYTNEVNGYLCIGHSGYLYLSQEYTWALATNISTSGAIKANKTIQANDFLGATIIKATSVPTEPQEYQLYDFGDNTKLWYYDGENWHSLATTVETPIVTANANDAVTRTDSKTESIIYLEEHIVELDENGIPILDKKINTSVNTDDSSLS